MRYACAFQKRNEELILSLWCHRSSRYAVSKALFVGDSVVTVYDFFQVTDFLVTVALQDINFLMQPKLCLRFQ